MNDKTIKHWKINKTEIRETRTSLIQINGKRRENKHYLIHEEGEEK